MDDNTTASAVAAAPNDPANTVQEMWTKFMKIPIEYNAADVVRQLSDHGIDLVQLESHMNTEQMGIDGVKKMYQAWDCLFCGIRDNNQSLFQAWTNFRTHYIQEFLIPNELGDRKDLLILLDLRQYVSDWKCHRGNVHFETRLLQILNERLAASTDTIMDDLFHDVDEEAVACYLFDVIFWAYQRTPTSFGQIRDYITFARNADRFFATLIALDAWDPELNVSGRSSAMRDYKSEKGSISWRHL